jgi:hypothetical protein
LESRIREDPHQGEKPDPAEPHQSKKSDPNLHRTGNVANACPRAVEAHNGARKASNGAVEAQPGAMQVRRAVLLIHFTLIRIRTPIKHNIIQFKICPKVESRSRIRIRIKVKSRIQTWIQIRIEVESRMRMHFQQLGSGSATQEKILPVHDNTKDLQATTRHKYFLPDAAGFLF